MARPEKYGFWLMAEKNPSKTVVVDPAGRTWTAGEMLSASRRIGRSLKRHGLQTGDVLAAAMDDSAQFLQLYFAALELGYYFAPLNPAITKSELASILEAKRPGLLVLQNVEEQASVCSLKNLLEEAAVESDSKHDERVCGAPLFYTSGTTGKPKAVVKSLPQISPDRLGRFAAVHLNAVCGIKPNSALVHLVVSPLYHSASLLWCTDHLHLGHTIVLAGGWDSEKVLSLIERHEVTGSLMVPTHFYRLLQQPHEVRQRYKLDTLRHVVHTGAPCPLAIKRKMLDWWGPVIYEVYGAAEGGGTRVTPQEWLDKPGTVGKSYGRIRIFDELGQECPRGETGSVFIKHAAGGFSYGKTSEETDKNQRDGYFTVGDRGYLDDDDYLFLEGREDTMIVTGGVNVYPSEIEALVLEHEGVFDALVVGVPDREFGQRVKAIVVPGADYSKVTLEAELRRTLKERLSAAKRPREFQWVGEIPRNSQGKVSSDTMARFQKASSTDSEA